MRKTGNGRLPWRWVRSLVLILGVILTFCGSVDAKPVEIQMSGGSKASRQVLADVLREGGVEIGESDLVMQAVIKRRGRRIRLKIVLINHSDIVAKLALSATDQRKLHKAIRNKLWKKIGSNLSRLAAEPRLPASLPEEGPNKIGNEVQATTDYAPVPELEKESLEPSKAVAPVSVATSTVEPEKLVGPGLTVTMGVGIFHRVLSFREDIFNELNGYHVSASPLIAVGMEWFPAAQDGRGGIFEHLGIGFDYEAPMGIDSRNEVGVKFPTRAFSWRLSLLGRLPVGEWSLGLRMGYGLRSFKIEDNSAEMPRPEVPNVEYKQGFVGTIIHTPRFANLAASAEAGYHMILDSGPISNADWFPNSSSNGGYGTITIDYVLRDFLNVYVSLTVVQQGFDLLPKPGDSKIAAGAIDRYTSGSLGLRYER